MDAKLLKLSRKGLIAGTVIMVVTVAMTITIGIWVISIFYGAIDQGSWSTEANNTFTNVQTYTWSGIQLLAVGIIILAAGVLLSYFGARKGK